MPNEVIAQVHRLTTAVEKYNGIVFTDMDGNILSEQFSEEEGMTYVGNHNNQLSPVEAVVEDTSQQPKDMAAIEGEAASTIGDENDEIDMNEMNHREQDNDNPVDVINDHTNDDVVGNSNEAQEAIDDNDGYSMDDKWIMIDNINIVSQMNLSQMALEEE